MRPQAFAAPLFAVAPWLRKLSACLAVWVSVLLLFTVDQTKAQQGPPLFQAFFVQGLMALEQGRNPDAVKLLEEALRYSPERHDVRKFLVIAAFRADDFDKAIQVAEQFLQTESDAEVSLLLARSYQATGQPEKAREIYASIAESENQEYAKLAETAMTALEAKQYFPRPPRLTGFAIAGLEYDSNIASSVEEGAEEPSGVADASFTNTLQVEYTEALGDRYFAGLGFLGFGNFHFDQGRQFDLQLLQGAARAGLVGRSWRLALEYQHDQVFFDYDDALASNRIKAALINIFSPSFVTTLIGSMSWDDFPGNPPQDATRYDVWSWNRFYIPALVDGAYIRANYQLTFNDTQERSVFQYYANEIGLGIFTPLPVVSTYVGIDGMYLEVDGSFEVRPYDEPNPDDRTDLTSEWSVTLGKVLLEGLSVEATFRRLVTDSTVSDFDKTENVVGVYTIFEF